MENYKKRMLIAEDKDDRFAKISGLVNHNEFCVTRTYKGQETYETLSENDFDIAIIDLHLLDKMTGQDVIRAIRRIKPNLPIIAMTALDGERVVEECLELGADDCITESFLPGTFRARLRTVMRHCRNNRNDEEVLEYAGISMDLKRRVVTFFGQTFQLTNIEFCFLKLLLASRGTFVSAERLELAAWGDLDPLTLRLEKHISLLRGKFKKIHKQNVIKNRREVGYAIKV